ncbi:sodium/proton antiporter NhaB [Pseudomonadales bacterium]|nr:sodium/proton antiporter NhaB [Pseudomonadales bacterium]
MTTLSTSQAFYKNFLGNAPDWYKSAIILFLILNPIMLYTVGPYVTGWLLIIEFIFTLAMALRCYPLQSGGLLAIEAIALGMASPSDVMHEVELNLPVILLLVFMVAGIYFMKDLLLYTFTKLLTNVKSKTRLSLLFCFVAAFLSAFLDALTVIAVIISVAVGFYSIYHKAASAQHNGEQDEEKFGDHFRKDLDQFRGFLRDLMMHAGVGTALGGVCTQVGEPQNLVIAAQADWQFIEFFLRMAPVTIPVLATGLCMVVLLEKTGWFNYGWQLPDSVRTILQEDAAAHDARRTQREKAALIVQAIVAVWLVVGLALHLAEVGIIGLTVIVLTTAFNGVTDEHALGKAFEEALPFTALLVVFFAIVAVIDRQGLFTGIIGSVLALEQSLQVPMFYLANGLLSAISDNVFVGTVYITELKQALTNNVINREQFDMLAVAINTGTNIPSVATPNGQAAFLFLLTSSLAPLIRLGYLTMVYKAIPYTIAMTLVGLAAVNYILPPATDYMTEHGLIQDHASYEHIESIKQGHGEGSPGGH